MAVGEDPGFVLALFCLLGILFLINSLASLGLDYFEDELGVTDAFQMPLATIQGKLPLRRVRVWTLIATLLEESFRGLVSHRSKVLLAKFHSLLSI